MSSRWFLCLAALAIAAPAEVALAAPAPRPVQSQAPAKAAPSIYDFSMKRLDGTPTSLKAYEGRVMLIVNTASKCGLAPQFEGLEEVHESYQAKGLSVLGFPSNDFLNQEPGTNAEIAQFCTENYGVSFPMFEKSVVKGEGQSPLYRYLTGADSNPGFSGEIRWNFDKFLINRHGKVVARFAPKVPPNDPAVLTAIEAELAAH